MKKGRGDNFIDPLELEPSLNGRNGQHSSNGEKFQDEPGMSSFDPIGVLQTLVLLIATYFSYYKSITYPLLSFFLIICVVVLLEKFAAMSTNRHAHKMPHDYSMLNSDLDFRFAKVDHWCLKGDDDSCGRCDDPTIGLSREQAPGWKHAHHINKKLVKDAESKDINFVLLGDAAVEEWNARHLGDPKSEFNEVNKYWKNTFTRAGGGDMDGLALGVAGDSIANLRWRYAHGEGKKELYPDVWWVLIGMNDIGYNQCSEEVVELGILKFAEELHMRHPSATVVVNSILPRMADVKYKKKDKKGLNINPYIHLVNDQLKKFADDHDHVEFVDVTSMFVESRNGKHITYKQSMFQSDGIHLSVEGHKKWGKKIKDFVAEVIKNKVEKQATLTDDGDFDLDLDDMYYGDDEYFGFGEDPDDDWDIYNDDGNLDDALTAYDYADDDY